MRLIVLILGLILPTLGMAQAYKCTEGGKTVYQASPCAAGDQRSVNTQGNSGMTGDAQIAAQERAREQARAARERAGLEAAAEAKAKAKAKRPRTIVIQQPGYQPPTARQPTTCRPNALGTALNCD